MKKMDEMELALNFKAIKWAWGYSVLFLAIWVFYEYIQKKTLGLAFILLMSQNIVFLGTQIFLKWKIEKNEK